MTEKAAETQTTDEQLFGNINFSEFEDSLITVDAPIDVDDDIKEEIDSIKEGGSGDPPAVITTGEDDPPDDLSDDKSKLPPDNTILVDVPAKETVADKEKKPEDTDEAEKGKKAKEDEENLSPMYLHAAALQEDGLLPDFDLESIKSLKPKEQALKVNEHIQKTIEEERENAIKQALEEVDEVKQMYEDIKSGVDRESLYQNMSLEEQYGKIQVKDIEDDIQAQESIYSDYLFMKGLSESKVKQLVDVAKENETLLTEAADGLKEIQGYIREEREEMRRQAEENKKAIDKRSKETREKINEVVTSTKEIIPGIELTKAEHDQLIKNITTPVRYEKTPDGREIPVSKAMDLRKKDPIYFEMLLNYFIEKGFFDKGSKFENLTKKVEKTAAKKFFDKMSDETAHITGKPRVTKDIDKEKEEEFKFPTFKL